MKYLILFVFIAITVVGCKSEGPPYPDYAADYMLYGTLVESNFNWTEGEYDSSLPYGIPFKIKDSDSYEYLVVLYPCDDDYCPEGHDILNKMKIGDKLLVRGELHKGPELDVHRDGMYIRLLEVENLSAELEKLSSEIHDIIGNAECNDVTNCHAIKFGNKPCGEPRSYLIYSDLDTDCVLLDSKVREYNGIDRILNNELDLDSDCEMVSPPIVHCQDGKCVEKVE